MLKNCFILLVATSVAMSQLIIDPSIPWGKAVIDQMVEAINKQEELHHLNLEYYNIDYTLGKGTHWTVYIILAPKDDKKYQDRITCTVDLTQTEHSKGVRKFSIGRIYCDILDRTTRNPSF